jgi:hypothetical protein
MKTINLAEFMKANMPKEYALPERKSNNYDFVKTNYNVLKPSYSAGFNYNSQSPNYKSQSSNYGF